MSIRAILLSVFCTLVVLLVGLVSVSYLVAKGQQTVAAAERQRFESWKLADELRQSSDDLTRMARTFVVTGDATYERYYNDILAIRNGAQPRPQGYGGIYWDFVAAGGEPGAPGPAIALKRLMREMAFTEAELAKLQEAQDRSDALVGLEVVAMNAVKGRFADDAGNFTIERAPDLDLARRIMHGEEYHREKARIMGPINEFFRMLEERTAREVAVARGRTRFFAVGTIALASVTASLALVMFIILRWRVIVPVKEVVRRLRDIAEGDGDLTRRIDESRRDELGELGHWYNTFLQMVHDIVREVAGNTRTVASAATEIAAAARNQEATVHALGTSTNQIAAALKQVSATGVELAATMREASEVARASASVADAGRAGLKEMESTMARHTEATGSVRSRLGVIRDQAAGINRIVTTMVKVADQTDLLSINAALEAEKAGEYGAGFRVVSREIRHLADQTAQATLGIERDVARMGAAVSAGATEVDTFSDNVRQVVVRVARVGEQFGQILEQVDTLTGRFQSVHEGMAQQTAGIEQINQAMGALAANAARTSDSVAEFTSTADHLHDATTRLEGEMSRFRLNGSS